MGSTNSEGAGSKAPQDSHQESHQALRQELIDGGYVRNAWYVAAWADSLGEEQVVSGAAQQQRLDDAAEQARGRERRPAPDGPEDVVRATEVVGDAGGTEPGSDGAPALGQQGSQKQQRQAQGGALVQGRTASSETGRQKGGHVG